MTERNSKDAQLAALLGAATILAGAAIYWWGQIQSVRELLEMAYG
ncbi:MAG: hypothetical protein R3228_06725 [Halioglobus sp.]|nr:hypothetical protein [Halioglobus sp.]